jgi:aryl-alcohol dehydrogenase-like predicted oxidoreductase
LRRPEVTAAIVGLRNPTQLNGVVGAAEFRLSEDECTQIEEFMTANPADPVGF